MQCARGAIEGGKCENAIGALKRTVDAEAGDGLDNDLGVGSTAKGHCQLGRNFSGVVEFAVVGDDEAAIGRRHRLMTGLRQVDDGEPTVAKAYAGGGVKPMSVSVGP